jgi:hypothetical protein
LQWTRSSRGLLYAELLAKLVAARHAIEILSRDSFDIPLRLLRDRDNDIASKI